MYQIPPLEIVLYIEKISNSFDLYVQTKARFDNVPFQIEWDFRYR